MVVRLSFKTLSDKLKMLQKEDCNYNKVIKKSPIQKPLNMEVS